MPDDPRRALPAVDVLLAHPTLAGALRDRGRGPVLHASRRVLAAAREELRAARRSADRPAGEPATRPDGRPPTVDELASRVVAELTAQRARRVQAVVNATGVVLHTNLGRAPLSEAARRAVAEAAGYATVEYDLESGARSRRGMLVEAMLCEACGAEAAVVANNAAAGLLLVLGVLARDREVVVSRGELIEIGGEFRLPAVLEAAGARLVEVGTTNRTHLADYSGAIRAGTALVLAVHPSNYRLEGFTTRPEPADLARLAHEHGLPLVHDIGSGLLTGLFGAEPSARQSLEDGADLVVFSGDKLLGGPQAGCVVGRAELVRRLARHPLARPVRPDKLTLAALEATLAAHLAGRLDELPVWRSLHLGPTDLEPRAAAVASAIGAGARVLPGVSVAGGGSLPGEGLPGPMVVVPPGERGEAEVLARLRRAEPPVIARAERGSVVLDLRTVPPELDPALAAAVRAALGRGDAPRPGGAPGAGAGPGRG